jgi:hypothetical protein
MGTTRRDVWCLLALVVLFGRVAAACDGQPKTSEATPEQIRAFFKDKSMIVVTFLGYSGAEYEDRSAMLAQAKRRYPDVTFRRTPS